MRDDIKVTICSPKFGYLCTWVALEELPNFVDRVLARGRVAIAESGSQTERISVGHQTVDFFRGRRQQAEAEGKSKPAEEVTILNPMTGGVDEGQEEPRVAEVWGGRRPSPVSRPTSALYTSPAEA